MSHKYDVSYLHVRAVHHLASHFPATLDGFRRLYPPRIPNPRDATPASMIRGRQAMSLHFHDLIAIINLAEELEIECILPCAYYLLMINFEPAVSFDSMNVSAIPPKRALMTVLHRYYSIHPTHKTQMAPSDPR